MGGSPSRMRKTVYTDGACRGNPGPGGWAYVVDGVDGLECGDSGGERATTNNRMEMTAVIRVLEDTGSVPLLISTDSKYVRDGIESWLPGWKRRGWRNAAGKPVKNKDLWLRIDGLAAGRDLRFDWVRGHSGVPGNELADNLAAAAADLAGAD